MRNAFRAMIVDVMKEEIRKEVTKALEAKQQTLGDRRRVHAVMTGQECCPTQGCAKRRKLPEEQMEMEQEHNDLMMIVNAGTIASVPPGREEISKDEYDMALAERDQKENEALAEMCGDVQTPVSSRNPYTRDTNVSHKRIVHVSG